MRVLAVEVSSSVGSVAIVEDGVIRADLSWKRDRSHGEQLMPSIESILQKTQLKVSDIERFAVGLGPGSFTGIRVGVSVVKALAYTNQKKIYGLPSLEILAAGVPASSLRSATEPILALVNAHSQSVYLARFQYENGTLKTRLKTSCVPISDLPNQLHEHQVCVGDGFAIATQGLDPKIRSLLLRDNTLSDTPFAVTLGLLAFQNREGDSTFEWNQIEPLYIRASGAEEKRGT